MCRLRIPILQRTLSINDEIDKLRLSATASLVERKDVIIVASVSCIYGLGSPADYQDMVLYLRQGCRKDRDEVLQQADTIFSMTGMIWIFTESTFRVRGDVVEIFPANADDYAYPGGIFRR